LTAKSFNNEIKNIVSNKHNYDFWHAFQFRLQ
jgi:hypothetical protein